MLTQELAGATRATGGAGGNATGTIIEAAASASAAVSVTRTPARRLFLLVLAAALLIQAAWILAIPTFGGIDEFDHVFKAEAVAHGQLLDDGAAQAGRGALVRVPADVVEAASAVCDSLHYTGHDNCHPVEQLGGGMVTVASAAASYNPSYYAVVGLMARPFSGDAADLAMRSFTALLAALLLAWAAVVTAGWARNAWPLLALLVTATPMLLYSSAVASPNGVGYAAACLLWAAALGLVEDPGRPRVMALCTAALTMMATHATGAMWLACVCAVVALLRPLNQWRALFHASRRQLSAATAAVAVGGVACTTWILLAKTNALTPVEGPPMHLTLGDLARGQLVWALQSIGAFPLRDEPAPMVVYALWLVPFVGLMAAGIRSASLRLRLAVVVLLATWVAVPMALTVVSFSSEGLGWQGRYTLPLAVGFPALAGLALNRQARSPGRILCALTVTVCASAQAISCARVAWLQADTNHSFTFAAEVDAGIVLIAVLAMAGGMLPLLLAPRRSIARTGAAPVGSHYAAGRDRRTAPLLR